jgi:hypothetical protein
VLATQLNIRADRVRAVGEHLKELELALSDTEISAVFAARSDGRRKNAEAKRLREATFPANLLSGTGGEQWKIMWESSRLFSEQQAYPAKTFPVIEQSAKCVLCQQDLDREAAGRLRQFEEFITSTTEKELRQIRDDFARRRSVFTSLRIMTEAVDGALKELRLEHGSKAELIVTAIAQNENRRAAVCAALTEDKDLGHDCPTLALASETVRSIASEIEERIKSRATVPILTHARS